MLTSWQWAVALVAVQALVWSRTADGVRADSVNTAGLRRSWNHSELLQSKDT
jgi:hypothetical protein